MVDSCGTPGIIISRQRLESGMSVENLHCPVQEPEQAGMSGPALARVATHLKSRYLDSGRLPGAQLLVYRRGGLVHASTQGLAALERGTPLRPDPIFRIYSMTKPITSVAFMMLVEEGRVALDDPVHKYIPEWKNLGVFQAGTR